MRQYEVFEVCLSGAAPVGSASQVPLYAIFTLAERQTKVWGFYNGQGRYLIRFYPCETGSCTWQVHSDLPLEGALEGQEECLPALPGRHGMVRTAGVHFCYEDGTRYQPFGTTVYALIHQEDALVHQTMGTLRSAPFNKVRLCVFPKHYDYNHNEPPCFPFEKDEADHWDVHRPSVEYWNRLESCLKELEELDVQADLILFHGYDRWGFSQLSHDECMVYLDYLVRRLTSFPNVWWSLANEYELLTKFQHEWWMDFAQFLGENDLYHHLLSNHNFLELWNFDNPYVTHCSIQDPRVIRVPDLQKRHKKPVIFDECCYEGNIPWAWGNLSAFELMNRFWIAAVMGGYCTHGETYLSDDEVLWWSKGGSLKGESPARIAFLRNILAELPDDLDYVNTVHERALEEPEFLQSAPPDVAEGFQAIAKLLQTVPERRKIDFFDQNRIAMGHCGDDAYLLYLGRQCCAKWPLSLPEGIDYDIEVIDAWEMTRRAVLHSVSGTVTVPLPSKEGIAILAQRSAN